MHLGVDIHAAASMFLPRFSACIILNAQLEENLSAKFTRVGSSTLGAYRANLSASMLGYFASSYPADVATITVTTAGITRETTSAATEPDPINTTCNESTLHSSMTRKSTSETCEFG